MAAAMPYATHALYAISHFQPRVIELLITYAIIRHILVAGGVDYDDGAMPAQRLIKSVITILMVTPAMMPPRFRHTRYRLLFCRHIEHDTRHKDTCLSR